MGNDNSFVGQRKIRVYVNGNDLTFDSEFWNHAAQIRCLAKGPFGRDVLFTSFECKVSDGRIDIGHVVDSLTCYCLQKIKYDESFFDRIKERSKDA